jgi:hypothetical protein
MGSLIRRKIAFRHIFIRLKFGFRSFRANLPCRAYQAKFAALVWKNPYKPDGFKRHTKHAGESTSAERLSDT